jgi:hypothetical protein
MFVYFAIDINYSCKLFGTLATGSNHISNFTLVIYGVE